MADKKPEGYVFGRPTVYLPEMCEQVIGWGRQGKSKAWIASRLEISRQTLDVWMKEKTDFSDAMTRALAHSQAYWEDLGQDNISDREFNASVWSRSMGARFPDDWRESTKQEQHVSGSMAITVATGVPREGE